MASGGRSSGGSSAGFWSAATSSTASRAGYETHYLNLASGSCGGSAHSAEELRVIRSEEAKAAAWDLGRIYPRHLVDDLCIHYEPKHLGRVAVAESLPPERV
jgi:hypothetical protein